MARPFAWLRRDGASVCLGFLAAPPFVRRPDGFEWKPAAANEASGFPDPAGEVQYCNADHFELRAADSFCRIPLLVFVATQQCLFRSGVNSKSRRASEPGRIFHRFRQIRLRTRFVSCVTVVRQCGGIRTLRSRSRAARVRIIRFGVTRPLRTLAGPFTLRLTRVCLSLWALPGFQAERY